MNERDPKEIIRDEMVWRDKIREILKKGPLTVMEVAEQLKFPAHEVMCWVMSMRKYGELVESGEATDDGFFRYRLMEKSR